MVSHDVAYVSRHLKHVACLNRRMTCHAAEDVTEELTTDMYQGATQIDGVRSAVAALRDGGAEVRHHLYEGGHDFAPWAAELCEAIEWLTSAGAPSPVR